MKWAFVALAVFGVAFVWVCWRPFARKVKEVLDDWRPTLPDQVRPGHDVLGGCLFCALCVFLALAKQDFQFPWQKTLSASVFLVMGIVLFWLWKTPRIEIAGIVLSRTDTFGRFVTMGPVTEVRQVFWRKKPYSTEFIFGDGYSFTELNERWKLEPLVARLRERGVPVKVEHWTWLKKAEPK